MKKLNEYGAEYWSAREIQSLLGYTQWRRFEDAIKRVITSCKQSDNTPGNHFAGAGKMVEEGKEFEDFFLEGGYELMNSEPCSKRGESIYLNLAI